MDKFLAYLLQLLSFAAPAAGAVTSTIAAIHSNDPTGTKVAVIAANAARVVAAAQAVLGKPADTSLTLPENHPATGGTAITE